MNNSPSGLRVIHNKRVFSLKNFFLRWEWMLVGLLAIIIGTSVATSGGNFLSFPGLMSTLRDFMDKAILVFPMMMIILLGDIDISVGSTIALCATVMGVMLQSGIDAFICLFSGILLGALCGSINGFLISHFKELSSVIVTVSTMIIYRGIATFILRDSAAGSFPSWITKISYGDIKGIPYTLIFFVAECIFFCVLLSKSKFGRRLYACGNNSQTSRYSGINTKGIKFAVFLIIGIFAALSAIILMSKMNSARPNIAKNYELDVIAITVLGGVATSGGKGSPVGVILSTLCICFLRYGLGLININAETVMIIIGLLLIIAVSIPNLKNVIGFSTKKSIK